MVLGFWIDKFLSLTIALILNIGFWLLGRLILRWLKVDFRNWLQNLLSVALGVGLIGMTTFLMGTLINFKPLTLWIYILIWFFLCFFEVFLWKPWINIRLQKFHKLDLLETFLLLVLISLVIFNLYRGLWPDVDFDSLWYHLTEPKIYLMRERMSFINGWYWEYSGMPQLAEMLYLWGVFLDGGITAKLLHTILGFWNVLLAFNWGKDFSKNRTGGLISALLFYSLTVVMWESQNAYIDLFVTFFISLGLYLLLKNLDKKNLKVYILAGLMMGFGVGFKLLSVYWVFIGLFIILVYTIISKTKIVEWLQSSFLFSFSSFVIWIPWGIYAYISTGNPLFPTFDNIFNDNYRYMPGDLATMSGSEYLIKRVVDLTNFSTEILSTDYGFNPLLLFGFIGTILVFLKKKTILYAGIIFSIFVVMWNFTPQRGTRFFMPVTILMSVILSYGLFKIIQKSKLHSLVVCGLIFLSVILQLNYYRRHFRPNMWVYSKESEEAYLKEKVSENVYSFYDYNGRVNDIVGDSKVLVYNVHNLFYLDFDFEPFSSIDSLQDLSLTEKDIISNVKNNFDFVLIKRSNLESFYDMLGTENVKLSAVYEDSFAQVYLYEIVGD